MVVRLRVEEATAGDLTLLNCGELTLLLPYLSR